MAAWRSQPACTCPDWPRLPHHWASRPYEPHRACMRGMGAGLRAHGQTQHRAPRAAAPYTLHAGRPTGRRWGQGREAPLPTAGGACPGDDAQPRENHACAPRLWATLPHACTHALARGGDGLLAHVGTNTACRAAASTLHFAGYRSSERRHTSRGEVLPGGAQRAELSLSLQRAAGTGARAAAKRAAVIPCGARIGVAIDGQSLLLAGDATLLTRRR